MALEMYRNSAGRLKLTAYEPVKDGSYVEVATYRKTFRFMHPTGLFLNNMPAFVPDLDELSESLKRTIEGIWELKQRHYIEQVRQLTGEEPSAARVQSIGENVRRRLPVCVHISIGRPLIISMTKSRKGHFDLGTIKQIDIYNQGQDPVTVR